MIVGYMTVYITYTAMVYIALTNSRSARPEQS